MSAVSSRAVFLSYASQDAEAAARLCEALRAAGVAVWFDQSELRGGDAWDAKIRQQIATCDLFVPVISAHTQARLEGYFRIEWKLAAQRTHAMAEEKAFLLPVVIDDTRDAEARVPGEFKAVQWTRLKMEVTPAEFALRVNQLLAGTAGVPPAPVRPAGETLARPGTRRWPWVAAAAVALFGVMAWWQPWRKSSAGESPELARGRQPSDQGAAHRGDLEPAAATARRDALAKTPLAAAPAPTDRTQVDPKSVAVLAFDNLSDDKANEYFSDGISEELINVLGRVPGLVVKGRSSSFYFKGRGATAQEKGQRLGATYLVDGSVRKAGNTVRITAQLIRAATDEIVWSSEPLTRELTDVLGLQEQIAGLIAQNLQLKLGGTERPAKAVNPEAHRLVLEGRYFWGLRTEDGFDRAEMSFRKALELDPEFAAAPAGLALVLGTRLAYTAYLGETVLAGDAQRTLAQRALTLDSGLAEAYAALAASYFNEGREAESQREYLKGLAVNPNSALLHHWYSLTLENAGRLDEALAEITRATDLDPLSGIALITRQRMLLSAGKYAEALELRERVAGLLPDVETSIGMQAISLLKLGRPKEAAGAAHQVPANSALNRRIIVDAQAIYVLRQTGHVAEATEHAAKILPRFRPNSYQRGAVLAALGRWEEAVPFLERTPAIVRYLYYWDPIWDAWRNDPKFKQLLVKLECADQYRVAREALARLQAKPGANK